MSASDAYISVPHATRAKVDAFLKALGEADPVSEAEGSTLAAVLMQGQTEVSGSDANLIGLIGVLAALLSLSLPFTAGMGEGGLLGALRVLLLIVAVVALVVALFLVSRSHSENTARTAALYVFETREANRD